MDTHGYAKCLENPSVVFCIWNGGLFCNQKKELEAVVIRENKENPFTFPVRNIFYRSSSPIRMAKVL